MSDHIRKDKEYKKIVKDIYNSLVNMNTYK